MLAECGRGGLWEGFAPVKFARKSSPQTAGSLSLGEALNAKGATPPTVLPVTAGKEQLSENLTDIVARLQE